MITLPMKKIHQHDVSFLHDLLTVANHERKFLLLTARGRET
jgi:hypothetical protein